MDPRIRWWYDRGREQPDHPDHGNAGWDQCLSLGGEQPVRARTERLRYVGLWSIRMPIRVANTGPDQSLCTTSGSATMAGSWIIVPAIGTWTLVSGTGTITQPNNPTTTNSTGMGVGQNIFQWTVNNGPCANGLTTDQMSFFILPDSEQPTGQRRCGPKPLHIIGQYHPIGR